MWCYNALRVPWRACNQQDKKNFLLLNRTDWPHRWKEVGKFYAFYLHFFFFFLKRRRHQWVCFETNDWATVSQDKTAGIIPGVEPHLVLQPLSNKVLLSVTDALRLCFRLELELYLSTHNTTLSWHETVTIMALTATNECSYLWSSPPTVLTDISTASQLAWLLFSPQPSATLHTALTRSDQVTISCMHTLRWAVPSLWGAFETVIHSQYTHKPSLNK